MSVWEARVGLASGGIVAELDASRLSSADVSTIRYDVRGRSSLADNGIRAVEFVWEGESKTIVSIGIVACVLGSLAPNSFVEKNATWVRGLASSRVRLANVVSVVSLGSSTSANNITLHVVQGVAPALIVADLLLDFSSTNNWGSSSNFTPGAVSC